MAKKPVDIKIANMEQLLTEVKAMPVTSAYFKERTAEHFDPGGLFSEEIFGEIGSPTRLVKFGYIDLNTKILHPKIFEVLMQIKSIYKSIVSGKSYARWDEKQKDFVACMDSDEGANTGYGFFVKHVADIDFKRNESSKRNMRIKVLETAQNRWFIKRFIVSPAGTREYIFKKDRDEYDEINKPYKRIIEMARPMEGARTASAIYDGVRYRLQLLVNEVYNMLWDMFSKVYFPSKYTSRSIALATRNVISAADIDAPSGNPEAQLDTDEVMLPLWQVLGGGAPAVKHALRTAMFGHMFAEDSNTCSVVDPDTLETTLIEVSSKTKKRHTDSEDMDYLLHSFLETENQHSPLVIPDVDGKPYYVLLKYIDDGKIFFSRSIRDIEEGITNRGMKYDPGKVSPLTKYEAFYRAGFVAMRGKHTTFTRYPAVGHLSIGLFKIHVVTTSEFMRLERNSLGKDVPPGLIYPRWPIATSKDMGGCTPHPCHLDNFGADHDGDMNNCIIFLSDDANKEIAEYLDSPRYIMSPDMRGYIGVDTSLTKMTLYNLTCGMELGLCE